MMKMYKKVQVGEVILASDFEIDNFIRILVDNGYIALIERVDEGHWQITILNKVAE